MSDWLIILALCFPPSQSGDGVAVQREFAAAQKLTQTGRWGQAGRALTRLLESHAGEQGLNPRLPEIVDLYRRCCFFEKYPSFDASQVVAGKLNQWNPRTGQLSVSYSEVNRDFIANGETLKIHPIEFTQAYRVEAQGRLGSAPTDNLAAGSMPELLVCVYAGESVQVSFGLPNFRSAARTLSIPARINFNGYGPSKILSEIPGSPLSFNSDYSIAIEVSADFITSFVDGRQFQKIAKPRALYGRVGILNLPGLTKLTLSGTASSSWLDSQRDLVRQSAWIEFRSNWKLAEQLPRFVSEQLALQQSPGSRGPLSRNGDESVTTRSKLGPVWEQTFEYHSRHYTVRSDIDRQTCFDAAQVLEAALRFYQFRLGRLSSRAQLESTYPVYVFAGRAGYNQYAGDQFGSAPENTAGLYSPVLKQLLVWNPAEPEQLVTTLRHEGLHQFVDATLGRLPAWFNEGMAEYFESAQSLRGRPTAEVGHQEHIALLLAPQYSWLPYEQLFGLPTAEFYLQSAPKYAQSWALIHWLLNSDLANARLFENAFSDLSQGTDATEISRRLLALGNLEAQVRAHLQAIEH